MYDAIILFLLWKLAIVYKANLLYSNISGICFISTCGSRSIYLAVQVEDMDGRFKVKKTTNSGHVRDRASSPLKSETSSLSSITMRRFRRGSLFNT